MSLFTQEEVCWKCKHAVFHECCDRFCHCKKGAHINEVLGICSEQEYKKVKEKTDASV